LETLDTTKLRLLREAVQHNVKATRRRQHRRRIRPTARTLAVLLVSAFLTSNLAYLSMPSRSAARIASVPAASTVAPPIAEPSTPSAEVGSDTPQDAVASPEATELEPPSVVPVGAPQALAKAVFPLSVKRVVLDPGHGGGQHGAIADSGVTEKELTLDIALRLRRLLKGTSLDVLMTRDSDVTLSLAERAAFANANRADLFVSIHVNWIPRRDIRPVETYYVGPTDDPHVQRLASRENRDSGFSLASYRHLLEKIYIDNRRDESRALARAINGELYRSLRQRNPRLENRGVKTAPFAVLVGTEMPAILVEVSCLSNEEEVDLLASADYREQIAGALLRGIRSYTSDLVAVGRKEG
jgi:N-acetylmuramoyl-L-alanine amidase